MIQMRRPAKIILSALAVGTAAVAFAQSSIGAVLQQPKPSKPDHIVIVIEENRSYQEIVGNAAAPYMNELFSTGASLVNHYATRHPSQPNYLDLFSGSSQSVKGDGMPKTKFATDNLASELSKHNYTFAGHSEGLPKKGYEGPYDLKTGYARKHNQWVNFTNVPSDANLPFSSFPRDYAKLPTVSFVIPNLAHDIHDGTVRDADKWLKSNLDGSVKWAKTHNSMLILTWDEDDTSAHNQIPTVLVGPMVKKSKIMQKTNHYSVLRSIEEWYGLPYLGLSKQAKALPVMK